MPHDHGPVLQFDENLNLTLSTLGSGVAIVSNTIIDASRRQGFYLIYCNLAGFMRGKTTAEGPVSWGLCANLTALELEAILEDDIQNSQVVTATGPGSWYLPISQFGLDSTEAQVHGNQNQDAQILSPYIRYPVKWTIPEGSNFSIWAYNHFGSALTTGMIISLSMQFFGSWLRD